MCGFAIVGAQGYMRLKKSNIRSSTGWPICIAVGNSTHATKDPGDSPILVRRVDSTSGFLDDHPQNTRAKGKGTDGEVACEQEHQNSVRLSQDKELPESSEGLGKDCDYGHGLIEIRT